MFKIIRLTVLLAILAYAIWLSLAWLKINKTEEAHIEAWQDGLAVSQQNGKYGYVNEKLKPVIAHQFDQAEPFIGERAITAISYGSSYKYRLIDKQGNYVGEFYDKIDSLGQGLYRVRNNVQGKKSGESDYYQWQLMNADGHILGSKRYHLIDTFQEGRARVCIKKRCGFIDQTGNEIVLLGNASNQAQHVYSYDYSDGTADTTTGKHQGFSQGLSQSFDNNLVGFRNTQGTLVIDHQFLQAKNFSENVAVVRTQQGWGVIDTQGNFVIKPTQYSDIEPFYHQVAIVRQDGQVGVINKAGKLIVPLGKYRTITRFDRSGTAMVSKDNDYGVIDNTGKEIIPVIYQEIFGDFNDGVIEAIKDDNPTVLLHLNKQHQVVGQSKLTISD